MLPLKALGEGPSLPHLGQAAGNPQHPWWSSAGRCITPTSSPAFKGSLPHGRMCTLSPLCVPLLSSSYKDTSPTGLGPTLMTSSIKVPFPNKITFTGSGVRTSMSFVGDTIQPTTNINQPCSLKSSRKPAIPCRPHPFPPEFP